MNKLWLVLRREYVTRVMTKGFVISTIAVPALLIGIIVLQLVIAAKRPTRTETVAVVDCAGGVGNWVRRALEREKLPDGQGAFQVSRLVETPTDIAAVRASLTSLTRTGALGGYLWIPRSAEAGGQPEFVTRNPGWPLTMESFDRAVSQGLIAARLQRRGLDARFLSKLLEGTHVRVVRLTSGGKTEDWRQTDAAAIVMAMLLYGSLMIYGVTTMRSVLEEKTTRIVEVLVSSVRPFELLAGKILGVAAVGLTQFAIWTISAGLFAAYGAVVARAVAAPGAVVPNLHVSALTLACLIAYFAGGYFLFAAMYAAIGAAVSSEQDAQQVQIPVSLLLVGSILLFGVILRDPSSPASVALSMIPFFSPVLMIIRIGLQTPPLWQIGLSLALLAVTTLAVLYASARIYRIGILMYGKSPSLVEMLRWLRSS